MRSLATRVRPVHAVVVLLLLLLMAGSATAGSLITGKQVRDGSLTGKDVKDRSIGARDLAAGLAATGPAGPQGPQGAPGVAGPPGPAGPPGAPASLAPGSVPVDALDTIPHVRAENVIIRCDGADMWQVPPGPEGVVLRWQPGGIVGTPGIMTRTCEESDRLVAPRTGVYMVTAAVEWPSGEGDTSARVLGIRRSGGAFVVADARAALPQQPTQQSVSTLVRLNEGQSLQVWVSQNSPHRLALGGTVPANNVTMQWVSRQ